MKFFEGGGFIIPLIIVRNDITKMRVDAIVNAANTGLEMGGGVCGAIFSAAGTEKLQAACKLLAPIKTGEVVITPGFDLPAKYIIHAAGPVYSDGKHGEEALLRSCYTSALDIAKKNGCKSVAFPLISSGIYGYPKDEALSVATDAIGKWILKNDMDVSIAVFDKAAFVLSQKLRSEVEAFIDENYIANHILRRRELLRVEKEALAAKERVVSTHTSGLEGRLEHTDESFSTTLFRLIDAKGKTGAEVYRRANIDRRLFSKIRTNKNYKPSKENIVAIAVALELTLDEATDLLERAGFTLSHSIHFDLIIEFFITKGNYDIFEINNVLHKYDQKLLGGIRD